MIVAHEHFTRSYLDEWLNGQLPDEECRRIDNELERCDDCRMLVDQLARGFEAVDELRTQQVDCFLTDKQHWTKEALLNYARQTVSIDNVEIIGVVAAGGQGVILEAMDQTSSRRVAVKILHPEYSGDLQAHFRLSREASIAILLEHPGVVPVYARSSDNPSASHSDEPLPALASVPDAPWMVMRYYPKSRLDEEIKQLHSVGATLEFKETRLTVLRGLIERLVQVCKAVAFAHSRGVVHADIKPSNILIGEFDETLLCDWGLCQMLPLEAPSFESSSSGLLTRLLGDSSQYSPEDWTFLATAGVKAGSGTPGYISPEQFGLLNYPIREATDIYALGAVLFEILTGKRPTQVTSEHTKIDGLPEFIPQTLKEIVMRAMAYEPSDRYLSSSERRYYEKLNHLEDDSGSPQTRQESSPWSIGKGGEASGAEQLADELRSWLDATAPVQLELNKTSALHASAESRLVGARRRLRWVQALTWLSAIAAAVLMLIAWRARTLASIARESLAQTQTKNDLATIDMAVRDWRMNRFDEAANRVQEVRHRHFGTRFLEQATARLPVSSVKLPPSASIPQHFGRTLAIAQTFDGQCFYTWGSDKRLLKWDSERLEPLQEWSIDDDTRGIGAYVVQQNGQWVIQQLVADGPASLAGIAVGDQLVRVRSGSSTMEVGSNTAESQLIDQLRGAPDSAVQIDLVRDGRDLPTITVVRRYLVSSENWDDLPPRFSHDANWLAVMDSRGQSSRLMLIHTADGKVVRQWQFPPNSSCLSLDFSIDGRRMLFSASAPPTPVAMAQPMVTGPSPQPTIIVFDLNTLEETHRLTCQNQVQPTGTLFTADGESVVGLGLGKVLPYGRWEFSQDSHRVVDLFPQVRETRGSFNRLSPDGRSQLEAGSRYVADIRSTDGTDLHELRHDYEISAATFSADGSMLAVAASTDISLYSTRTWTTRCQLSLQPPENASNLLGLWQVRGMAIDQLHGRLLCATHSGLVTIDLRSVFSPTNPFVVGTKIEPVSAKHWLGDSCWTSYGIGEGGFALRKVSRTGQILKTEFSSMPRASQFAYISEDERSIFVPLASKDWTSGSKLEHWRMEPLAASTEESSEHTTFELNGQPVVMRNIWSDDPNAEMAANTCRVVAMHSQSPELLVESLDDPNVELKSLKRPSIYKTWSSQEGWGKPFTTGPLGILNSIDSFTHVFATGFERELSTARLVVGAHPNDPNARRSVTRVLLTRVSSDKKFFAALIADDVQEPYQTTLKLFALPDVKPIASLDQKFDIAMDFALDFSPDNKLLALATLGGDLTIWDYAHQNALTIPRSQAEQQLNLEQASYTGLVIKADGQRVIVSLNAVSKQGMATGCLAALDLPLDSEGRLQTKPSQLEFLSETQYATAIGNHSGQRQLVALSNNVLGEVSLFNLEDEAIVFVIPRRSNDERLQPLRVIQSVDCIAVSQDEQRMAIGGPTVDGDQAIAVWNPSEAVPTLHLVKLKASRIDDLVWQGPQLHVLAHQRQGEALGFTAQLGTWNESEPGALTMHTVSELATSVLLAPISSNVQPCFSPAGDRFLLPIQRRSTTTPESQTQGLAIYDTQSRQQVAEFFDGANCQLHSFDWNAKGEIAVALAVANSSSENQSRRYQQKVVGWSPDRLERSFELTLPNARSGASIVSGGIPVLHLSYSPDGECLALHQLGSKEFELWSIQYRCCWCKLPVENYGNLQGLWFSEDGQSLFVAGSDHSEILNAAPADKARARSTHVGESLRDSQQAGVTLNRSETIQRNETQRVSH